MEYVNNFNKEKFEDEVFGVGRFADAFDEWRPGWTGWNDVRQYFGLYGLESDERDLREGKMSQHLYDSLIKKIGEERLSKYFGAEKPKLSKEEQEVEDLALMMFGTVGQQKRK